MQVVFQEMVYSATGFGNASREIAFAMEDMGVDVKLEVMGPRLSRLSSSTVQRLERMEQKPLREDRLLLTVHFDYFAARPSGYRKTISCVMFETSKAPRAYVDGCNRFDGLIVPCEMNRQAFRNGGVKIPIYIAHYGVDSELYTPDGPSVELGKNNGEFVFLSVFAWSDRKAPDILIRAFLNEFDSDEQVRLVLKTHGAQIEHLPNEWYENLIRQVHKPNLPKIQIITKHLSLEEMSMLYRGADCFVLPTRGEGVGLPYLESMATGLPVIATDWGGQTEFIGPRNGYLIPYRLVPAHPVWFTDLYQPDQLWAEPDEGALQRLMRHVYLMRDEAKQKGKHGRIVAEEWNWRRTGREFIQAIESIVGQPIR